jgi:Family of unknown function (DUF6152)
MKRRVAKRLTLAALLGIWLGPAAAHHTFIGQYDPDKPVTMTGIVTRVEWTNPHARFYLDVTDDKGVVTSWNFELASPNVLRRYGWTGKSLQPGDRITVDGSLARDGSPMANALSVTLHDGRKIFAREAAPVQQ